MSDPIYQGLEETKVEYRNLGKSGLRVSVPIFGCMSFGQTEWQPWVIGEEEAKPLLKAAYDRGLNTWDTANVYSNGNSEEIIGRAIKEYKIPREKLVLLSKCYGFVGEDPNFSTMKHGKIAPDHKDYVNRGGLSRAAIFKAVNASLARLGTDYLDLLQIHRFDPRTPVEETMKALHDLVTMGKVHYIGASSMWAYQFATMQFTAEKNGWTKFVSMQNHYSLLYREEEREMNKFCHETGVGLIPWAPLARGLLARAPETQGSTKRSEAQPEITEVQHQIISRVQEIAQKHGWAMSQVAMAWILRYVSSPIIGFSSVKRIDEAIEVRGKTLTDEEVKYLEEPYKAREIEGH